MEEKNPISGFRDSFTIKSTLSKLFLKLPFLLIGCLEAPMMYCGVEGNSTIGGVF